MLFDLSIENETKRERFYLCLRYVFYHIKKKEEGKKGTIVRILLTSQKSNGKD